MSRSVENGKLLRISPSSINAFDGTTGFGCERRWWLKYVAGEKEPETANLKLGTELHALIENHLLGTMQEVNDSAAAGLYLQAIPMVEEMKARGVVAIEAPVEAVLLGVPLIGYCDLVVEDGIVDWKTTSDFKRYAKTPAELREDTQMLTYARFFHPTRREVTLTHGYVQTKGRLVQPVSTTITLDEVNENIDRKVLPLVDRMKQAAGAATHTELKPEWDKCRRCPFYERCPKEPNAVSNFFAKLTKSNPTPSTEAAVVLPPDAPASKPELAAKPVEGFSPVPAPKRLMQVKDEAPPAVTAPAATPPPAAPAPQPTPPQSGEKRRGRPPGAKNKPKGGTPPAPAMFVEAVARSREPVEYVVRDIVFKSVRITEGLTINLGNYNSAKLEVCIEADVGDLSVEEATKQVHHEVMKHLEKEAAKYEEMIQPDKKGGAK